MGEELSTIQKRGKLNRIHAYGEKGPGGAYHHYKIYHNGRDKSEENYEVGDIQFQEGGRNVLGSTSGVSSADLLEIVRHQLQCFQKGEFSCRENAIALTHIEDALLWLNQRAEDRIEREVLGSHVK